MRKLREEIKRVEEMIAQHEQKVYEAMENENEFEIERQERVIDNLLEELNDLEEM